MYCRPVALTVEHRTPNPGVGGSNPSWPANLCESLSSGSTPVNGIGRRRASRALRFQENNGKVTAEKDIGRQEKEKAGGSGRCLRRHFRCRSGRSAGDGRKARLGDQEEKVTGAQKGRFRFQVRTGKDSGILGKKRSISPGGKVELKKVTWPSRQQTLGSTVVVLILVMIISLFLGLSDIALSGRDPCRSSIDRGGDHRGAKMVHRSCIFRV